MTATEMCSKTSPRTIGGETIRVHCEKSAKHARPTPRRRIHLDHRRSRTQPVHPDHTRKRALMSIDDGRMRELQGDLKSLARAFARTQMSGKLAGEDYNTLIGAYPDLAQHITLDEVARGDVTDFRLCAAIRHTYADGGLCGPTEDDHP